MHPNFCSHFATYVATDNTSTPKHGDQGCSKSFSYGHGTLPNALWKALFASKAAYVESMHRHSPPSAQDLTMRQPPDALVPAALVVITTWPKTDENTTA